MDREISKCPLSLMTTFTWILCAVMLAIPFLFYKTNMSQTVADIFFALDLLAYIMGFHFLMTALADQEKFIMENQIIDMTRSWVDIRWAWMVLKVLGIGSMVYWMMMSLLLPVSIGLTFLGVAIYIFFLTRDSSLVDFTQRNNFSTMITTNCDLLADWQIKDIEAKREAERGGGYANLRKMQEGNASEKEWS